MSPEMTNEALPQEGTSAAMVYAYLTAMEARELERAKEFLSTEFSMTFPGGHTFSSLDQLVEWGKGRYSFVKKTFEHFDEMTNGDQAVVYCYGTLYGEALDGSKFSGIRFIDRFTIQNGRLTNQKVWNDMGAQ